jgi:hypothetical protein
MELIAVENNIPPYEVCTTIQKMIKMGFRENEATELHTAKISFPRTQ